MSEQENKPKTIEEIMVDVAFLKAQASSTRLTENPLPEGTPVRLSKVAVDAMSKSVNHRRHRAADVVGTVVGFDVRQGRIKVEWPKPKPHTEMLAPKFLEMVGK